MKTDTSNTANTGKNTTKTTPIEILDNLVSAGTITKAQESAIESTMEAVRKSEFERSASKYSGFSFDHLIILTSSSKPQILSSSSPLLTARSLLSDK